MNKSLSIVIIGGRGLIGKTLTNELSKAGHRIICADINNKSNNSKKINDLFFVKTDINNHVSLEALISKSVKKFGNIDALINCSFPKNSNYGKKILDVDYKDFTENIKLHLGGYFLATQIFTKYFLENGAGRVINFASIYGTISPKFEIYNKTSIVNSVEYASIKSGIIQMNKFFAKKFLKKNIQFNTISPGGIKNNHSKKFISNYKKYSGNKGMLDPKDIVGLVSFLLSKDAEYITGQNLTIDDGFSL